MSKLVRKDFPSNKERLREVYKYNASYEYEGNNIDNFTHEALKAKFKATAACTSLPLLAV